MTGLCARRGCFDAPLPNSDFCGDHSRDEVEVMHTADVIQLTRRCQFGHPACSEQHPCADCVEFASYPKGAA
jgi:hypothetical protein